MLSLISADYRIQLLTIVIHGISLMMYTTVKRVYNFSILILLLILTLFVSNARAHIMGKNDVVVTIAPLYSLVSQVMQGVGSPYLIYSGIGSVHHYSMKPSQVTVVRKSKLVFIAGADLSHKMDDAIDSIVSYSTQVIDLSSAPGVKLLKSREKHVHDEDDYDEDDEDDHDQHEEHHHVEGFGVDPHYWLDPVNAIYMIESIVSSLSKHNPSKARLFRINGNEAIANIKKQIEQIKKSLLTKKGSKYFALHDGYQYFEHRFGLGSPVTLTNSDDAKPGPKTIKNFISKLEKSQGDCVIGLQEGSSYARWLSINQRDYAVKFISPVATGFKLEPDLYFKLMKKLEDVFYYCAN